MSICVMKDMTQQLFLNNIDQTYLHSVLSQMVNDGMQNFVEHKIEYLKSFLKLYRGLDKNIYSP